MPIELKPGPEAQLIALAERQGRDPAELTDEALGAYLERVEKFAAAVERGPRSGPTRGGRRKRRSEAILG